MQERDFHTGGHIPTMIEEGLRAKWFLSVMSEAYLRSDYCLAELGAAIHRDPTNSLGRIVIVRISQCDVPALLAPISRIELVGKSGEMIRSEFLEGIKKLKRRKIKPTKVPSPTSPSPYSAPCEGPIANVNGDGGVAFVGNNNKIYMPQEGRRRGRAKPPADVISEEQAVKLKVLVNEVMELDSAGYGRKLTEGELRQKWWGALEKVVPKTTYRNYSQSKFRKAMRWLLGHRRRLISGSEEEQPELARQANIRTIHTLLSACGIRDEAARIAYYNDLSDRLHITPSFGSSADLSDKDLQRVVNAMRYDSKKNG